MQSFVGASFVHDSPGTFAVRPIARAFVRAFFRRGVFRELLRRGFSVRFL